METRDIFLTLGVIALSIGSLINIYERTRIENDVIILKQKIKVIEGKDEKIKFPTNTKKLTIEMVKKDGVIIKIDTIYAD